MVGKDGMLLFLTFVVRLIFPNTVMRVIANKLNWQRNLVFVLAVYNEKLTIMEQAPSTARRWLSLHFGGHEGPYSLLPTIGRIECAE